MTTPNTAPVLLTVEHAAERHEYRAAVRPPVDRGTPDRVHKLGRYVRISEPALAAFIEAGRVPPMEASVIWRQNRQVA